MGDQDTADACHREALELFRSLGDRLGQGWALEGLGLVQMATGDYPAAAASFQRVLRLHRELGARHSEALTLNSLGELSRLTSAAAQAREYHGQALAIARDLGTPLEEARALEGIGESLLADDTVAAAASLRQALAIYQRIGTPGARRVQDTLDARGL
jgi:tetratricopeptide (TPR) repeat protein